MSTLLQDLRYGFRMLWKSPAVAVISVVTLALGIGATTGIFSVVNGVLLRPMPYYQPGRLVMLWGNTVRAGVVERRGASYPDFRDWRDQSKSFDGMAYGSDTGFTLNDKIESERLTGEFASATYFDLLGVKPRLGRGFLPPEDAPTGSALVAVISSGLWQRRFGSDPAVIGRVIQLNRKNYTVVGVAQDGFRGITDAADVWIPTGAFTQDDLGGRGSRGPAVVARLQPGASVAQAQAELNAICQRLAQTYPQTNDQRGVEVIGLQEDTFSAVRKPMLVIFGAVLLVLLISCVNISNLLLARAEGRRREIAIRIALGASRWRTVQQLLTESAVLAAIGGAFGLLLGTWAVPGLLRLSPIELPTYVNVHLDARVLGFTAGLALATALLVGALPALFFWKGDVNRALSAAGRTGESSPRQHVRAALVVTEVALAMMLLVGAGLLIRSFQRLTALDPGFQPDGLLTLRLQIAREQDSNVKVANRALAVLERLRSLPGVKSVSFSSNVPLDGNSSAVFYSPEGNDITAEQKRPRAYVHRVSPDFFSTMQIPLLQGRTFTPAEMTSEGKLIIVSQDVARRYWPGENPVGKHIKQGAPNSQGPNYEVVGVVGDVKYRGLPRNPTPDPDLYFPLHERSEVFSLAVRSAQNPAQFAADVRAALKQIDATMPIYNVATMRQLTQAQLAPSRFAGFLMGLFAGVALLLALVGTYSVMSYVVTQRTREIGIRMALGAQPKQIFEGVIRWGALLGGIGVALGIAGAIALRTSIASLLYQVSATSPLVIGSVALLMLVCALVACYLPARRATRVDPMVALRYE